MRALLPPESDHYAELPDEVYGLTYLRHWRIVAAHRDGQISRMLDELGPSIRAFLASPDPRVVQVLDPRESTQQAAELARLHGQKINALIGDTLAASSRNGGVFYTGNPQNASGVFAEMAAAAGVKIIYS